jgi:hypothetical protein
MRKTERINHVRITFFLDQNLSGSEIKRVLAQYRFT